MDTPKRTRRGRRGSGRGRAPAPQPADENTDATEENGMRTKHELAGKTVTLSDTAGPGLAGQPYEIEDWWANVAGQSWMYCAGTPACLAYAVRSANVKLPLDDEVVYGKVAGLGHLVHVSELGGAQ